MEFLEEQKYKNEIGIYKIVNLANDKVYVGQTKEKFQKRFWLHRWKLRNGIHDNIHLQRAWNKYKENNFVFEVIEILPKEEIDEREKFWINFYRNKDGCYSIQNGGQPDNLIQYVSKEGRKAVGEKIDKDCLELGFPKKQERKCLKPGGINSLKQSLKKLHRNKPRQLKKC